jgi:hypothetical protein
MNKPPTGIRESRRYDKQACAELTRERGFLRLLVGSLPARAVNHFPEVMGLLAVDGLIECGTA